MNKALKRAACVFIFICAIGLFSALAGGVRWGTFWAGAVAAFTLISAALIAGIVLGSNL
ncbi:hypothetical protein I4Y03_004688 [Salmonella enterica subsp. enterica serovar Abony]|nr:hypothetical protein [Salmonella enterica subsp. enterica serovar Abony]